VDSLRAITKFVKHALRSEVITQAGYINLVGLVIALAIVLSLGATDVFQAIVRIGKDDYTTGLPGLDVMFGLYLLAMLGCVLIVGLLTREK
jgi:amino acid transporter